MPPGISRLPISQAGVPALARTGGFEHSQLPSASPARRGNVLPKSRQILESWGSAVFGRAHGRSREGWCGWGQRAPRIPSPFLPSRASSQGRAERQLRLGGRSSPHARAASPLRMCRRSQEPSGELGECKRYFASLISRGG